MRVHRIISSKGQTLVLFAIGLLFLLAISALVIDGGKMYLNRRVAQTAADAGALAGAYELCSGGGPAEAIITAERYATQENGASSANATIDPISGEIQVSVQVEQKSFFAQLLGINEIPVPATAASNCFPPNVVDRVLPIAWSCRPPSASIPSDSQDCQIQSLSWPTEMQPLLHGPYPFEIDGEPNPIASKPNLEGKNGFYLQNHLYIVMDTDKLAVDLCKAPIGKGIMNCDLNGDGVSEVLAGGGDRSWLYLDYDLNNLKKYISGEYTIPVQIHKWLPGKPGSDAASFGALTKRIDDCLAAHKNGTAAELDDCRVFVLPVFNTVCPKDGNPATCQLLAHETFPLEPGQTEITPPGGFKNGTDYFHIVGFSEFYVSCVHKSGAINCPGENAAKVDKNIGTVEGYFIRGYPAEAGTGGSGGADLGVYINSLTK